MTRRYGWVRDLPDPRDHRLALTSPGHLPPKVDLRAQMPPIYDQGQLGSCTANAIAACLDFERARQGLPMITPSRLFIYYGERLIEHSVESDAGAQIRDGIKVVAAYGVCPEAMWPYIPERFAEKPPMACYATAALDRALSYSRVGAGLWHVKACLAQGFPVTFGFMVHESFESEDVAKTGIMPVPEPGEQPLGGHAVAAVGYDDSRQALIVRNSWGAAWGDGGHFYMPYGQRMDDRWMIRLVG